MALRRMWRISEIIDGYPKGFLSQLGSVTLGLGVVGGGVGLIGATHFFGKKRMHDPNASMITYGMLLTIASLKVIRGINLPKYLLNMICC